MLLLGPPQGQSPLMKAQRNKAHRRLKRRVETSDLYINQSGNIESMQFAMPFMTPPLYYYFFYPNNLLLPPQTPQLGKGYQEPQNALTTPGGQEQVQIQVTREDLMEEGYEQSKKPWTEEEDELLMKLCSNPQAFFDEVAQHLPGRNSKMCYSRYRRLTNQSKKSWTRAENEKLKNLVEEYGENQWKQLARFFTDRSFKQLKDHYENFLQPNLHSTEWTVEEDLKLINLINLNGQKWKYIQSIMPHRSCSQLKNRFFGRIKRLNDKKLGCDQAPNKLGLLTI